MATLVGVGANKVSDNKEIVILEDKIKELTSEIAILNAEKSDLEKLPDKMKNTIDSLTEEKESLEKQVETLTSENTELVNKVTDLEKQVELAEKKSGKKEKTDEE